MFSCSRLTARVQCSHIIHSLVRLHLLDEVVQQVSQHDLVTAPVNSVDSVLGVGVIKHHGHVVGTVGDENSIVRAGLTHSGSKLTYFSLP